MCLNDLGHDKESIYFYNKYIIDDLKIKTLQFRIFIIGLMDHLANLRTSSFSQTSCFVSRIFKQKLNWNFFATDQRKGENDGDVKNVVVTSGCHKQVVTSCDEFVSVGNKTFPDFVIPFFPKESVRFLTFLSQRYQQLSKPLVGMMYFHHIKITNKRIVGHLLSTSCLCHQDVNQVEKKH